MTYIEVEKGYESPLKEEGQWGVYETECPKCGKSLVHVALVVDVDAGYVTLENEVCFTCTNMPGVN